jgi:hypothetical protein
VFKFTSSSRHQVFNTNIFPAVKTIAATALVVSSIIVQADPDTAISKLHKVAATNSLELGSAIADDHWTRVEFSKVYADPVVIVESSYSSSPTIAYIVGIRNVDAMGFEMILKNCDAGTPLQETINFSVIDKSQLYKSEHADTAISQRFAWGECGATRSS